MATCFNSKTSATSIYTVWIRRQFRKWYTL